MKRAFLSSAHPSNHAEIRIHHATNIHPSFDWRNQSIRKDIDRYFGSWSPAVQLQRPDLYSATKSFLFIINSMHKISQILFRDHLNPCAPLINRSFQLVQIWCFHDVDLMHGPCHQRRMRGPQHKEKVHSHPCFREFRARSSHSISQTWHVKELIMSARRRWSRPLLYTLTKESHGWRWTSAKEP